jgi:CBS-domain-containing membrane protein
VATTVAEIMDRDPAFVSVDADAETAISLMRDHELPGLPVVAADRRVVGIVTDSDLIIRDEQADLHMPHFLNLMGGVIFLEPMKHFEDRLRKAFATKVSDLMTADPITVRPEDPATKAAKLIASEKHNRLPVVDEEGRLAGVVTRVDVLAALIDERD